MIFITLSSTQFTENIVNRFIKYTINKDLLNYATMHNLYPNNNKLFTIFDKAFEYNNYIVNLVDRKPPL